MPYPKMYAVRQTFAREREEDLRGAVQREIEKLKPHLQVRPGARVAITVGSRGIRNIAAISGAVVDGVKSLGGRPFIFPAMGSHGGATAEGQAAVLRHYGVRNKRWDALSNRAWRPSRSANPGRESRSSWTNTRR